MPLNEYVARGATDRWQTNAVLTYCASKTTEEEAS